MANEIRYYDTPYTFISPVRHFKSNDPYYYEVDNIPVKQLEESQNFLKDQVDGIIARQNNKKEIEIDRSGFSELKPYAVGNDRKVRVKPGKFTARINNAYSLTPLQVINQVAGFSNTRNADGTVSDLNTWEVQTNIGSYVSGVLNEFQQGLLGNALNMNGLAERAFTFPVWDDDGFHLAKGFAVSGTTTPGYFEFDIDFDADDRPLYPNYIGSILQHSNPETTRKLILVKDVYSGDAERQPKGNQQGRVESEFIRRWRGAIRTSVVDVPEELVATVPDFDLNDFYYVDGNGNQQPLNANQRIDLLFIYSKAVDEESTTIPRFDSNGNPTTLTKPALGILKGAGIGISREEGSVQSPTTNPPGTAPGLQLEGFIADGPEDRVNLQSLDGTPIMLAHPGDENGTNNGFTTSAGVIKGSFPSPDDLMNLAPLLSEQLETTAFQLIGQSILPIAYIRVQTDAGPIADVINDDDIIDIRPFFRTTELAYNERAGIAAATPQVSLANPVVTEANLEIVRKEMYSELNARVSNVEDAVGVVSEEIGAESRPRIIAAGNVLGGFGFGPEGALINRARENAAGGLRNATMNALADVVESEFGIADSVTQMPQWDKAQWYGNGGYTGSQPCDYINVCLPQVTEKGSPNGDAQYLPPWGGGIDNGESKSVAQLRDEYGSDKISAYKFGDQGQFVRHTFTTSTRNPFPPGRWSTSQKRNLDNRNATIYFVTKRIKLDFENTPWVSDYQVKVNFMNCVPLSTPRSRDGGVSKQASNVWVQKHKDYFTICVAWAGPEILFGMGAFTYFPWANRNNVERFVGFAAPEALLLGGGSIGNNGHHPVGPSLNVSESDYTDTFEKLVNNDNSGSRFGESDPRHTDPSYLSNVKPLLYPSVQWEVVGIPGSFVSESVGSNGVKMRQKDPTIKCR